MLLYVLLVARNAAEIFRTIRVDLIGEYVGPVALFSYTRLDGIRTADPVCLPSASLKIPALDLQRIDMKIRHLSRARYYAEPIP